MGYSSGVMWRSGLVYALLALWLAGCGGAPKLKPLQVRGRWHKVEDGDTIKSVARKYKSNRQDFAELNDLESDEDLKSREEVFIPTGRGKTPGEYAAKPVGAKQHEAAAEPHEATNHGEGTQKPSQAEPDEKDAGPSAVPEKRNVVFIWPVDGEVTSVFGIRRGSVHEGIDIQVKEGTPVKAAGNGVVLYAGNELKGYGNLVILQHDKGLVTVYAHNKTIKVKEGTKVKVGDVISLSGQTGHATGPHLHFEVREGDKPRNPLFYLPERKKSSKPGGK